MFSRGIIDNSRSINDTSIVIRMMIVYDSPSCCIILVTLEVSFTIVIYFIVEALGLHLSCFIALAFEEKIKTQPSDTRACPY
jgi:hypothetical protein